MISRYKISVKTNDRRKLSRGQVLNRKIPYRAMRQLQALGRCDR